MSKKFMGYCKKWLDEHQEYSVQQKVIWIYDLIHGYYQGGALSDREEMELYSYIDPDNTIKNPAELWFDDETENLLEEAINDNSIMNTYTITELCKEREVTWSKYPQSVDVYFINRDGESDNTQFDLYEDDKTTELEALWFDQCDETFNADADSVTEIVLYGDIQG